MARVAYEHHRGFSGHLLDATAEGLVGHVVLHDVYDIGFGALVLARELVEGNAIPISHKPNASCGVVNKELRRCNLTA